MSPNRLQRQFNPDAPDERWVTDITYIRTHEGWLYLAVVVDLFSRKIIGWSMQSRMTKDIVLNALLMAVWRRNPEKQVLVHSDQGSQYTSHEWQSFLKSHGLEGSMSRRGNCHDNAVAESFFQLLKRERIKKKIYGTREEARSDIFDYIEMFITVSVGMVLANRCHRQNMKTSIINGSEVSRLSVAIHTGHWIISDEQVPEVMERQRNERDLWISVIYLIANTSLSMLITVRSRFLLCPALRKH
ncbi:transposase insF for insertion sequence IS3A/B/C/D/E/fA [Atlantibacter hermannii]|nr:transposase insF for insertion sequence IS3A/B/C/D/E/fA [Atlantibacter hermannii]